VSHRNLQLEQDEVTRLARQLYRQASASGKTRFLLTSPRNVVDGAGFLRQLQAGLDTLTGVSENPDEATSPPIQLRWAPNFLTDGEPLSQLAHCDAVILLAYSGRSKRRDIRETVALLEAEGVDLLGVVLLHMKNPIPYLLRKLVGAR